MVKLSRHAQTRMQQRGIPGFILSLLLDNGESYNDGRGAEVIYFTKKVRQQLRKLLSHSEYVRAERHFDIYAVMASETLITVGHRTQKIYR